MDHVKICGVSALADENITIREFSELAEARSKTYGFLSLIYLRSLDEELLQKMFTQSFRSFLTSLIAEKGFPKEMTQGLRIVEDFIDKSKKTSLEELRKKLSVEYTRLFRGVKPFYGPPPPYESVYLEGRIMGESTVKVSKEYSKAGVSIPNKHKTEPPDHISFELDFMRHLSNRELLAWKKNNLSNALRLLEEQKKFINEHLIKWVPNFCNKVLEEAKIGFYQGIAKITKSFVQFDFDNINTYIEAAKHIQRKAQS
jgi:TorA maturation chaperone TorD